MLRRVVEATATPEVSGIVNFTPDTYTNRHTSLAARCVAQWHPDCWRHLSSLADPADYEPKLLAFRACKARLLNPRCNTCTHALSLTSNNSATLTF